MFILELTVIKMTILLRRKPGMSHQDFVAYHRDNHGPLFSSLEEVQTNVRRYVQCHPVKDKLEGIPDFGIDGSTELWFDDLAGLAGVFASPHYLAVVRPDEEKFLDLAACEILVGEEHEVVPQAAA